MKKKKKNLYICLINIVVSIIISLFIDLFMYSDEVFNFQRFITCVVSFWIFLLCFSNILIQDWKSKGIFKKELNKLNIGIFNDYKFLIKYLFSFILTLIATILYIEVNYLLFGLCELFLIYLLTNILMKKHPKLAKILNCVFILLYNINVLVLIFGCSFVNLIMLTNLGSLEDLKGKAFIYGTGVVLILIFSFLPIKENELKHYSKYSLVIAINEIIMLILFGFYYSPILNYGVLAYDEYNVIRMQRYIKSLGINKKDYLKNEITDYVHYDLPSSDKPNIILILTEGLSNHIIYDARNIMPNLKKFSEKSIRFENYYNHTAATYRGIIGQLYSGYQNNNLDSNRLISIQQILSDNNYDTTFINTEPNMREFYNYLNALKFNKVLNKYKSRSKYFEDKEAYNLLYNYALKSNENNKPFFVAIYTFGTHVSLDSDAKKYGNGKNSFLNKFYNADYQFGQFLKKFNNSPLYDNTILVFTTDHATYVDSDYAKSFKKKYNRIYGFLDEIPLFIYYKGVVPQTIDVNGRNSLDLAPTILDFMDISDQNYFLGESLFSGADGGTKYDTYYFENSTFLSSKNDMITDISNDDSIKKDILYYLAIAKR